MADQTPEQQTPVAEQAAQQSQSGQQQIQVNIDYLKTTRVHICMPCYGGMLTEQTFMSFIKWSNTALAVWLLEVIITLCVGVPSNHF